MGEKYAYVAPPCEISHLSRYVADSWCFRIFPTQTYIFYVMQEAAIWQSFDFEMEILEITEGNK